jgi:NTE family protein
MASGSALARTPLFAGLTAGELDVVAARMRPRRFASGERLCSAGDPVDQVWVITGGLVHWLAPTADGEGELVARMRKGDVIGAQDVITGEQRLASVIASIPTSALEIDSADLLDLARQFPEILINIVRVQRERLFRANARSAEKERGEEIALVFGPSLSAAVGRIVAAARTASARPLTYLDRRLSFAGALTAADDLVSEHATVLIPGELDPETLAPLLEEVDRVVALAGSAAEAERLGRLSPAAHLTRLEVVLVGEAAVAASKAWPVALRVVRTCVRETGGFPLADADLGWLARHITRTKLGLALGAGGVKGYAHVGALQVLEEAGYTVDVVGGSSIGGFVATHVALGYDSAEINARFRAAFNPETVAALFASAFGGGGKSAEVLSELLQKATAMKSFDDVVIPLAIMAVDLTDRLPRPLREGPLWEALAATLAVAGVFPPRERDGHRLVDGLHLVPVPTGSVLEDGADIVVSVNLMGAETLDRWPDLPEPEEAAPARKGRYNALDTMLEVMDLSQVDTSERHANIADVVITPRFGPADWRDFHLGDLFLAAGRAAALEQLPALQAISRPVDLTAPADGFSRSDSLIV